MKKRKPELPLFIVFGDWLFLFVSGRHCSGEEVWQRGCLLVAQLRMRQRLAGQHLVAHGGVVDKDGLDGSDLLEVACLQAFIGVLVGVVGAALVIQVVLNELEAVDADGVEGEVVGAAGIAHRKGGYTEVFERSDPLRKDGRNGGVFLQVDAADFTGAVRSEEIAGDELPLGLDFERSGLAEKLGQLSRVWSVERRRVAEVLLDVSARAVEALFFTAPQCYTDGTAWFDLQRIQDAH